MQYVSEHNLLSKYMTEKDWPYWGLREIGRRPDWKKAAVAGSSSTDECIVHQSHNAPTADVVGEVYCRESHPTARRGTQDDH